MDVKIKDRKEGAEYLRMALNMCELWIDYPQAELIIKVLAKMEKVKGEFSISDGVKIHHEWKKEWEQYFQIQKDAQ
jgi:hypothetical protein